MRLIINNNGEIYFYDESCLDECRIERNAEVELDDEQVSNLRKLIIY